MIEVLQEAALAHGDKLRMVPIERLHRMKTEIEHFKEKVELNGFQQWIVNSLYHFDLPDVGFSIKSIILVAIPHPFYAKVEFIRLGKKYELFSPAMSNFKQTEAYLNNIVMSSNYHMKYTYNLPYKRLAVKCGLATYGRNNISYIDGMGSSFAYAAYFTDIPCRDYEWVEIKQADSCENCRACINNCPTGAILLERFLINNERCLSCHNEVEGEFPEWIPYHAHHLLYDCLKCQIICPMNKDYKNNIIGPVKFSEEETNLLLSAIKPDEYTPELKQKAKLLGFDQWVDAIPRNLNILFDLYDSNELKI